MCLQCTEITNKEILYTYLNVRGRGGGVLKIKQFSGLAYKCFSKNNLVHVIIKMRT